MRQITFIFLLNIFFFLGTDAYSATITALASGNWTTNSTWSCNCQPSNADNVVIPAGITVTNSGPVILFLGPVITITISGTLILNNGSLQVDASDIVTIKPGGKISGAGILGGAVYSGASPIFIANGSSINGPSTITSGSLPITLLFFTAEVQNKEVLLQWASASEKNFDFYSILRSRDGIDFETIGKLPGAGNSTTQKDYSYGDADPIPGVAYYRLVSVDKDGNSSTYEVVMVNFETSGHSVEIFPNPATGNTVNVKLNFPPEEGEIGMYDSRGNVILQKPLISTEVKYAFELAPSTGKGFYFVIVKTKTENLKTKIIVN